MIPISIYQEFCKIPTGSTLATYNLEISKLINLDISKLTDKQVVEKVNDWVSKLVTSKVEHKYIRLKNTYYKIDIDLYTMKFSQWIYLDKLMKDIDEQNVNEIMHNLISIFLKPCKVYKWFPSKFNSDKVDEISQVVQSNMDIQVGLEIINRVFFYTIMSMKNTQIEYSEELVKEFWKPVKE